MSDRSELGSNPMESEPGSATGAKQLFEGNKAVVKRIAKLVKLMTLLVVARSPLCILLIEETWTKEMIETDKQKKKGSTPRSTETQSKC